MGMHRLSNEELCVLYQDGNQDALTALLKKNQGFIERKTKTWHNWSLTPELDLEDLIQEATIGMIKAAQRYCPSKGIKFIHSASSYMRMEVIRAMCSSDCFINVPIAMYEAICKIQKHKNHHPDLNREEWKKKFLQDHNYDEKKIEICEKAIRSLDRVKIEDVSERDSSIWVKQVWDNHNPDEEVFKKIAGEILIEILRTLRSEIQIKVLTMRFGFQSGKPMTLEEVGQVLECTREKVRQIEAKALRRLRHPCRARRLKDFLD